MPLPKSSDPGKIIRFLKREKPGMPQKQRIAIALSQARKSGAKISKKKSKKKNTKSVAKANRK